MIKISRNKYLILLIVIIVLVCITGVILYNIFYKFNYSIYEKYEEKMKTYGFDNIYDNKSVDTYEYITRYEAIKMAISTMRNYSDFNSFYYSMEKEEQTPEVTMHNFLEIGLIDEIKDHSEKVTYIEVLEYFVRAKEIILEKEIISNNDIKIKGIENYDVDKQKVINDMVQNKIIKPFRNTLPLEEYAIKGMINEIVVNFVEVYDILTNGKKLEIKTNELPSNHSDYPYILEDVEKEVYEKEFNVFDNDFESPAKLYSEVKEEYEYIEYIFERYFDVILNVDYTNFDEENFKSNIKDLSLFFIQDDVFDRYFEYVKSNEIKISGKAIIQYPAIYYDGLVYRVRTKIDLNIENAKDYTNIFFRDLEGQSEIKYNKNNTIIIDVPISRYYNTGKLAIDLTSLFLQHEEEQHELFDSEVGYEQW